ncbi:MAG TPA: O-antigen ligase family protein [Solirubrobacteraceae bacterium]|nr:O-antigen ligase family protein [Solirubrobacteraceae bacterium]
MSTPAALDDRARVGTLSVPGLTAQPLLTSGLAAIICAVAVAADGGLQLNRAAPAEMALVLGGGLAVAGSLLLAPRRERLWGAGPLALLVALAILTALSVTWAANPSDAWLETNRAFAYVAVFAAAAALAHAVPGRWGAVLGAITLAAVVVSAYAVTTKIAPGLLNPDERYARLREPFGYWNSVGLMAALGVPGVLWLGSRRTGHQTLNALAYPALGLLGLTMLLSYSRGALLAAAAGAAFWLVTVKPLRLRAAAVLLVGATGAAVAAAWAFSQGPLSDDRVPLGLREQAGLQLLVLVVVLVAVLTLAGLCVGFVAAGRPPSPRARRRIGVALLACIALVPVLLVGKLALSDDGLGGSISSSWSSLTDPDTVLPVNDPSRLASSGSVRARYWDEALRIFRDNVLTGVGAGGYATVRRRYRRVEQAVRTAHGYPVQTLADLGIAGMAVSLALLAAWLASAAKATGLRRRRRDRVASFTPERIGLLTLVAVVVVFGVHSTIDWTWFVPGNAIVALLAAGWVAGRGPLGAPTRRTHGRLDERLRAGWGERSRAICAGAVVLLALLATWTVWQPLRADALAQRSLDTLLAGDVAGAREQAQRAHELDPLAVDPLFKLAQIEEQAGGRQKQARAALQQAVDLQPANPETWLELASFELQTGHPRAAVTASRRAVYLDPRSSRPIGVFLDARRQIAAAARAKTT